mmetsp:Transcript_30019/g.67919  ORF Transcript_30019/g.67919 Transcript_30019/m.67919 type:complete len:242 (-) Transcript_30019:150-875(-)
MSVKYFIIFCIESSKSLLESFMIRNPSSSSLSAPPSIGICSIRFLRTRISFSCTDTRYSSLSSGILDSTVPLLTSTSFGPGSTFTTVFSLSCDSGTCSPRMHNSSRFPSRDRETTLLAIFSDTPTFLTTATKTLYNSSHASLFGIICKNALLAISEEPSFDPPSMLMDGRNTLCREIPNKLASLSAEIPAMQDTTSVVLFSFPLMSLATELMLEGGQQTIRRSALLATAELSNTAVTPSFS